MANDINELTESRSEETKARIFDTTTNLVELHGIDSLTVRKIADESNVSPALIIQYFGSKDKLLQQIFELRNIPFIKEMKAKFQSEMQWDVYELFMWISEHLLERDLATPRLTLQVMAYSFRWDEAEEESFLGRLNLMLDLMVSGLMKTAPLLSKEFAQDSIMSFLLCYAQSSRIILQRKMSKEEGMSFLQRHVRIIANGVMAEDEVRQVS